MNNDLLVFISLMDVNLGEAFYTLVSDTSIPLFEDKKN